MSFVDVNSAVVNTEMFAARAQGTDAPELKKSRVDNGKHLFTFHARRVMWFLSFTFTRTTLASAGIGRHRGLSVCLTHAGIVSTRLNVGSRKHHKIARDSSFLMLTFP